MQTCPSCGTASPQEFKFCPECATALEAGGRATGEALRIATEDEHAAVSANGLLAELAGAADEAAAYADAAARWRAFGMPYEEAHALLGEGRSLIALDRRLDAGHSFDRAGEIFSRLGAALSLRDVERCRARLAEGRR
jgi:hypothetical protein